MTRDFCAALPTKPVSWTVPAATLTAIGASSSHASVGDPVLHVGRDLWIGTRATPAATLMAYGRVALSR